MKLRNRRRQSLKTKQLFRYISYFTLALGIVRIIVMVTNYLITTTSHGKNIVVQGDDIINNGEIITDLSWENKSEESISLNNSIESISKDAH